MSEGEVQINPNRIFDRLKDNLAHTAELVAYGVSLSAEAPQDLHLPGSLLQFGARPAEIVGGAFQPWMLSVGLRRYIEVFQHYLVDVGFMSELLAQRFDDAAEA